MAPRISSLCTAVLQDEGVYGAVEMYTFPMEFVPLEKDVLSLELENSYKSIFLVCFVSAFIESAARSYSQDGDYGPIYDMGKALITFQRAFGLIPRIVGKGDAAHVC